MTKQEQSKALLEIFSEWHLEVKTDHERKLDEFSKKFLGQSFTIFFYVLILFLSLQAFNPAYAVEHTFYDADGNRVVERAQPPKLDLGNNYCLSAEDPGCRIGTDEGYQMFTCSEGLSAPGIGITLTWKQPQPCNVYSTSDYEQCTGIVDGEEYIDKNCIARKRIKEREVIQRMVGTTPVDVRTVAVETHNSTKTAALWVFAISASIATLAALVLLMLLGMRRIDKKYKKQ